MFVLCIEYLTEKLQMSKLFQGFKIENQCMKLSLFADVTLVHLNGNFSRFIAFLRRLAELLDVKLILINLAAFTLVVL